MDAASFFGSANGHFVNEDYEEALKHYTCAATLQDDCAEYRANRAACYLKLGKFTEALEDAEAAVGVDDRCHMGFHWKGVALFYMGDFASSKVAFEASLRIAPAAKAPRSLWVRKCDAELSGSTLPLRGAAAEASKVPSPAVACTASSRAPVPAAAVPAPAAASSQQPTEVAAEKDSGASASGGKKIRHEWYQNNSHVFITIFAKGLSDDVCKSEFKERECSIIFPMPGSSEDTYSLELDLCDKIDPAACTVEISKVKVEVKLAKKEHGRQWKDLEEKKEALVEAEEDQPAYPSSNKTKRDWNQVDRDMDEELKNEKGGGDEALNGLFKQIYDRADDDTRRAMNKSFQTSGGTVLSTNWGEVAKSDYEGKDRPTPPEGQEWKDWRDKK